MSEDLSDGQTFGAFSIVEVAGSGGMGVVYRAQQRSLGRTVALKVIRPEIAESGDYRSRFLREARLAAAVNHPNVVSVIDVGEHAGRLYLTMQWVDGRELRALIDDEHRLDPARTVRIGVQIALALNAVHEAGLVHRDVKPSNVLVRDISGEDHAYLTDFGVAKMPDAQDGLTRTGWIVGTSGYLSPEQIRGQQPGPRSDLYALGCIIFEALTGQRPFSGESDLAVSWAHANRPRPVASDHCPALGPRYDAFLAKALAVDPHDRFPSGRAFAEALQSAHAGAPSNATHAAPASHAPTQLGFRAPPEPTAIAGIRPAHDTRPSGAPEPTTRGPAVPEPTVSAPRTANASPGRTASPGAPPSSTPPPPAGVRKRKSPVARLGRFMVLIGGIVFIASVTLLTGYSNFGNGAKSLLDATTHDLASPLVPIDFWIVIALAAVALVLTIVSVGRSRRPLMIGAALASLGLVGYTLRIPSKGSSPGFGPYGSSYWLSLAAAAVMLLGAVIAAAARSSRTANSR